MIENNMVDAIVSTAANIVDQDFFEGLGFRHYIAQWSPENPLVPDEQPATSTSTASTTLIDEDDRACDDVTREIFDSLPPGGYCRVNSSTRCSAALPTSTRPSRASCRVHRSRADFVPALSDCSAGFGIVIPDGRGSTSPT